MTQDQIRVSICMGNMMNKQIGLGKSFCGQANGSKMRVIYSRYGTILSYFTNFGKALNKQETILEDILKTHIISSETLTKNNFQSTITQNNFNQNFPKSDIKLRKNLRQITRIYSNSTIIISQGMRMMIMMMMMMRMMMMIVMMMMMEWNKKMMIPSIDKHTNKPLIFKLLRYQLALSDQFYLYWHIIRMQKPLRYKYSHRKLRSFHLPEQSPQTRQQYAYNKANARRSNQGSKAQEIIRSFKQSDYNPELSQINTSATFNKKEPSSFFHLNFDENSTITEEEESCTDQKQIVHQNIHINHTPYIPPRSLVSFSLPLKTLRETSEAVETGFIKNQSAYSRFLPLKEDKSRQLIELSPKQKPHNSLALSLIGIKRHHLAQPQSRYQNISMLELERDIDRDMVGLKLSKLSFGRSQELQTQNRIGKLRRRRRESEDRIYDLSQIPFKEKMIKDIKQHISHKIEQRWQPRKLPSPHTPRQRYSRVVQQRQQHNQKGSPRKDRYKN